MLHSRSHTLTPSASTFSNGFQIYAHTHTYLYNCIPLCGVYNCMVFVGKQARMLVKYIYGKGAIHFPTFFVL